MKKAAIVFFVLLFSIFGFAQKQPCEDLSDSVKIVTLNEAKLMSELIPKYPREYYNTIIDYVSVEILATCNGKVMTAIGTDLTLTIEQKNILKTVDIGSKIYIKIKFKYKDPENDKIGSGRKIKDMEFKVKASRIDGRGLLPCVGC